jgi:ubiquitin-conjugating enzyme E2 J1
LDPSDQYTAAPLENDMFEWHFTIRGAESTDFDGGIYHGRILLPAEYPFKPPHIVFLTQSGRFEINTKVCLSFSAYHPELWQPAWGIRLILEALISFLPTPGGGAIGALDYSSKERKRLAKESQSYCCKQCGPIINLLPKLLTPDERKKCGVMAATKKKSSSSSSSFAKEIEELKRLQLEREGGQRGNNNNKNKKENEKKEEEDDSKKDVEDDQQQQQQQQPDSTTSEEEKEEDEVEEGASSSEDNKENSVAAKEKESDTTTTAPTTATTTADDAAVGEVEVELEQFNNAWMYDTLLNVSIVLLCLICVLFTKKAFDLSVELQELQDMPLSPMIDGVKTAAADAVTSSLASAASTSSGGEDL